MADFKITEKDGYEELENVQAAIQDRSLDIKALWALIGQGDTDQAAITLFEAGFEIDEEEVEDIKDIVVISTPDDIGGESYRIWIRLNEPEKAHVHDDECRSTGCKKGRTRANPRDFREAPGYRGCSIHSDDVSECKADPKACRWTCDVHDQECLTPTSRHYADTKSFMCDEARKQFLKDYHWDDKRGEWVERS